MKWFVEREQSPERLSLFLQNLDIIRHGRPFRETPLGPQKYNSASSDQALQKVTSHTSQCVQRRLPSRFSTPSDMSRWLIQVAKKFHSLELCVS